jgi:hypothetical protein
MGARSPAVRRWACGALLAGYAAALFHHTSFAVGGSDSSGYLNAARLFSSGRVAEPIRGIVRLGLPDDYGQVFVPLGYTPIERPRMMAPSYPPGLPLHMAVAARVAGWSRAPFLVPPLAAVACLVLFWLLARELRLPRSFALAGCALLAFFPTFVFQALQPMSDVPATAWALAAVFAAYRARARGGVGWAALAGASYGVGVLVRPTNALLLAPLLFALPARPKAWLGFVAGGVPAAAFLATYDTALFGRPWTTGYRTTLADGMEWGHFPERARHYGFWLARLLTPLVPLGWLAVAADRSAPLRDRAVLVSWFGAFFLFYCFYAPYEAWWYTRFLLPGVPALILGALVVARDVLPREEDARIPRTAAVTGIALVVAALVVEVNFIEKNFVRKFYRSERIYPRACEMARRRVPENGIVASMQMSGALHYYTPLTYAMHNWLLPERFAALRTETESRGYRWYALLSPFETEEVRKNLPGDWREIDRAGDIVLWELPPSSPP